MKFVTLKQMRVVQATTGKEFEEAVNTALADIAEYGYKYEIDLNKNEGHCAYIFFEIPKRIPETLEDEYDIRGERHFCSECPYFIEPQDRRIKHVYCELEHHTMGTNRACEEFYELLAAGKITLKDEKANEEGDL